MPQPSTTEIHLKITCLKFHSDFPGANGLNCYNRTQPCWLSLAKFTHFGQVYHTKMIYLYIKGLLEFNFAPHRNTCLFLWENVLGNRIRIHEMFIQSNYISSLFKYITHYLSWLGRLSGICDGKVLVKSIIPKWFIYIYKCCLNSTLPHIGIHVYSYGKMCLEIGSGSMKCLFNLITLFILAWEVVRHLWW